MTVLNLKALRVSPRILFAGLIASLAIFMAAACSPPPEEEVPVRVEGATAATVNGEKIYVSDVELEAVARGLVPAGTKVKVGDTEYDTVLSQLIEQKLMSQEAIRRGLDKDPAGRRRLEMARERILGNLLVENLVAEDVTEDQIEAMYQKQVALQQDDDEVRISHILVATKEDAQALFDRIQAGESFESLVSANSLDSATRMEQGDLGYVSPNDEPAPFPLVIANTGEGEVAPPFESADGWHILKVKDRRSRAPKTREEMRPDIVTFLTLEQVAKIVRRLKAEAQIQQGEPGLDDDGSTPYRLPDMDTGSDTPEDPSAPASEGTEL
ncbi:MULTISPECIES: peptidylprolyl isomerase [Hyphomonas]|nr:MULTISPECIES: peptidylprolyl isomerase [Hyphomonas]|tara:strand:+ start:3249 stop:4226 length:978 start_codon:yes stop_codon:yes gene_type:complete